MSLTLQIQDDITRAILDWGVAITYRVVERQLDHETQLVTENFTDTSCSALIESEERMPTIETAGQSVDGARRVVVSQDELPADAPQLTDRVLIANEQYDITAFDFDSITGLISLQVAKR